MLSPYFLCQDDIDRVANKPCLLQHGYYFWLKFSSFHNNRLMTWIDFPMLCKYLLNAFVQYPNMLCSMGWFPDQYSMRSILLLFHNKAQSLVCLIPNSFAQDLNWQAEPGVHN